MSSVFYSKIVPDINDFYNQPDAEQRHPGHLFEVHEKDGELTLFVFEGPGSETPYQAIFLNPGEAEELLRNLQEAIKQARSKGASRPNRARDAV